MDFWNEQWAALPKSEKRKAVAVVAVAICALFAAMVLLP